MATKKSFNKELIKELPHDIQRIIYNIKMEPIRVSIARKQHKEKFKYIIHMINGIDDQAELETGPVGYSAYEYYQICKEDFQFHNDDEDTYTNNLAGFYELLFQAYINRVSGFAES